MSFFLFDHTLHMDFCTTIQELSSGCLNSSLQGLSLFLEFEAALNHSQSSGFPLKSFLHKRISLSTAHVIMHAYDCRYQGDYLQKLDLSTATELCDLVNNSPCERRERRESGRGPQ